MNECIEVLISTENLAKTLQVGASTVKRAANKLRPVLGEVMLNNFGGYMFNERQATLIKNEIAGHHNLQSRQIDNVSTELEENEAIANAMMILQRRNNELKKRCEMAETRALRAEETNNLLMHCNHLFTVTEVAKELGLKSAIELNNELEKKGIQFKVNGIWVPTSKYSNCGYFEIKQQVHDDTGYVYYDRKITIEGRKFILELFRKNENKVLRTGA